MASVTGSITSQSTRRSLGGRGMLVSFTYLFCCCCYIHADIHTYIIFVKAYIILAKLCGNAASVADTLKLGNFFPSTVKKDQVTYFRRLLKKRPSYLLPSTVKKDQVTSVDADLFKRDRPNFPINKNPNSARKLCIVRGNKPAAAPRPIIPQTHVRK